MRGPMASSLWLLVLSQVVCRVSDRILVDDNHFNRPSPVIHTGSGPGVPSMEPDLVGLYNPTFLLRVLQHFYLSWKVPNARQH